eukprot:SAG31_NODE_265_length_18823_cov_5.968863_5_plen_119_part_00
MPDEFQASAGAYVGKKKKKKKIRKPAGNTNERTPKSTKDAGDVDGHPASESEEEEEEEEEALKPSHRTGSVSVYRGGPLKSGTTQAAAGPNASERADSPTGVSSLSANAAESARVPEA